jgi:hypothetical protein
MKSNLLFHFENRQVFLQHPVIRKNFTAVRTDNFGLLVVTVSPRRGAKSCTGTNRSGQTMGSAGYSETFATNYKATKCQNPGNHNLKLNFVTLIANRQNINYNLILLHLIFRYLFLSYGQEKFLSCSKLLRNYFLLLSS